MSSSSNRSIVKLADGREVCLSYGVPVAAFIPGRGYVKTATRYSVTTSKHANQFAGKAATEVPATEFASLVAPLEVKS